MRPQLQWTLQHQPSGDGPRVSFGAKENQKEGEIITGTMEVSCVHVKLWSQHRQRQLLPLLAVTLCTPSILL